MAALTQAPLTVSLLAMDLKLSLCQVFTPVSSSFVAPSGLVGRFGTFRAATGTVQRVPGSLVPWSLWPCGHLTVNGDRAGRLMLGSCRWSKMKDGLKESTLQEQQDPSIEVGSRSSLLDRYQTSSF